jgi:hypothetical protein
LVSFLVRFSFRSRIVALEGFMEYRHSIVCLA